ncbi:MAG: DNA mismatch repair endonuclease MutL, partial [bacterium]
MPETNKIKILPENLTNKIAAGEVVDRPASVVKELIENSIDAGADNITIIIKDGGKALIQVVDNGYGMHESDLLLAFQRHTTSKIFNYEDLSNIQTLGFRGEALASIASVSLVEAKSVQHDQTSGHLLRMEGGVMQDIEGAGGNPGTSIAVKHLFYNTPARRKFMRKTNTEYRQILNVSNRFFLAYPEITFTLINEGEIIVDLKKASLEQRIKAVLGARIQKNLIPIENEGYIRVSGFTGNQDTMRSARGDQYLYFNRRYFTNKSLNYAVISA